VTTTYDPHSGILEPTTARLKNVDASPQPVGRTEVSRTRARRQPPASDPLSTPERKLIVNRGRVARATAGPVCPLCDGPMRITDESICTVCRDTARRVIEDMDQEDRA
jgi:hypothetical protein